MKMIEDGHLGGYIEISAGTPNGDPMTYCPNLWKYITLEFNIDSFLDIGCGQGHAVKWFKDKNCDSLGIEGCLQAIETNIVKENVLLHDFTNGKIILDKTYDMIWSCEFLEHVEEKYLDNVLDVMKKATDLLAITHAGPTQGGHHHVNCQPHSYWIDKFKNIGWDYNKEATKRLKTAAMYDNEGINWFVRNGLAFTK